MYKLWTTKQFEKQLKKIEKKEPKRVESILKKSTGNSAASPSLQELEKIFTASEKSAYRNAFCLIISSE
jgi:mRNA-degrading endonuclease RelE of RelBE toxin-antitoxin system